MSLETTEITPEILAYVRNTFTRENEFLASLTGEALEKGFPPIAIAPEQAQFLQFILKAINAKNVLEIGSLYGYSAIAMAMALPDDGCITAIEIDSSRAAFINQKIIKIGLENKIKVVNTNAVEFLENLPESIVYDFIFLDADKENYSYYFEKANLHLRLGGIIAADNALAFGNIALDDEVTSRSPEVTAMKEFNTNLANHSQYFSSIVTLGDGIALGIKIRE